MQQSEKDCIRSNLPKLLQLTVCNVDFISILESKEILTGTEVEKLLNPGITNSERAYQMYMLVQTRSNDSFLKLKYALGQTKQTGALRILDKSDYQEYSDHKKIYLDKTEIPWTENNFSVFKGRFGGRAIIVKFYDKENLNTQAINEIRQLEKLDWHENVLRYYIAKFFPFETRQGFGIVLDQKPNLKTYIASVDKNAISESAQDMCAQVVRGVQFLHNNGVLHLNVDLESVFVCTNNISKPTIKIGEFGVSRCLTNGTTRVEISMKVLKSIGAGAFFTPEVLEKDTDDLPQDILVTLGYETDIFGVGVLIYYITSNGYHPFGDSSEWVYRIRNSLYSADDKNNGLSTNLNMVKEAFSKLPLRRPSISELADLLQNTQISTRL